LELAEIRIERAALGDSLPDLVDGVVGSHERALRRQQVGLCRGENAGGQFEEARRQGPALGQIAGRAVVVRLGLLPLCLREARACRYSAAVDVFP
jgi:hypothetical protein